ncbi:hypothetical protein K488DRAFT_68506 [Vararia minispora EC-137]|uniref:Uncharacterized protein n=1 Tax=Vararia minispora EC-137 TaxID=1314806 RepID=A0ACB8QUP9_9AGAM|nr:hypothetical protein K488DRAFT_68506 [Vararia minispora EC-137]
MSDQDSDAFEDGSDDIGSVNLSLYELQELPTSSMAAVELKLARKLQAENITLKAKKVKSTGRLVGEGQKIGWAGAASCVMVAPWITTSTLQAPRPPASLDLNDPSTRFASSHSRNAATLAEVYNLLDPSLHPALENEDRRPSFIHTFLKRMSAQRQQAVQRVKECGPQLLDLEPTLWTTQDGARRRKSDSRIRALLSPVYGDEMHASYPNFPKLLFQYGPDGQADKSKPFRNDAFPKLLAVILFGPSVLNEAKGSRKSSGRSNAALWGVTSVTPGAIALVAVIFYFWLSPDTELYENGVLVGHGGCGVSWGGRFDLYKKAILRLPKRDRDGLFDWYNAEVFGKTANHPVQALNFDDDLSYEEIVDPLGHMLAGLNVMPDIDEEDHEVETPSPLAPTPPLELSPEPLRFTLDTEPVPAIKLLTTVTPAGVVVAVVAVAVAEAAEAVEVVVLKVVIVPPVVTDRPQERS